MIKLSTTKKNFIYYLLYNIITPLISFITAPYLARTIGPNGVGTFSYTYSIVQYFMLFAMLGLYNYGNRIIAKNKINNSVLSKEFISLYTMQFINSLIIIVIYLLYIVFYSGDFKVYLLIETFYLLSAAIDISWFFSGIEKFKTIVIKNTIIKIFTALLIFIFVKNENSLLIYVFIMSISNFVSQIILWSGVKKYVKYQRISKKDIVKHIKPCFVLFISVIAISIYRIMDKIMIGIYCPVVEVGFYEQAEKIVNIPLTIITSLGVIMLPRISNLLSNDKKSIALQYFKKSIQFVLFLAVPITFGLMVVSKDFIDLYLGKSFSKSAVLLILLSITIIFSSLSTVIRTQYLIPKEKDKVYIKSVIIGAIVNLIANIIFIPIFSSAGACIGTILAEFSVLVVQILHIRKEVKCIEYVFGNFNFVYKGLLMLVIVYIVSSIEINLLTKLLLEISTGIVVYSLLNIKYIHKIVKIRGKI